MGVTFAASLADAVAALEQHEGAMIIAGGTDLMVGVNEGRVRPLHFVSLQGVSELRGWTVVDDRIVLGASMTFAEIESDPQLAASAPALVQAARTVGSPQIRNAGTLGGNLATCSPAGDSLPVFSALDASVSVFGPSGERTIPFDEFMVGPKRSALGAGEIITAVSFPAPDGPSQFLKVGTRNAMVISIASVAAVADVRTSTVRIALGSVGPRIIRATEAERLAAELIFGTGPEVRSPEVGDAGDQVGARLDAIGAAAAAAASPIDDQRSTAAYRRHAVGVCVRRAVRRLLDDISLRDSTTNGGTQ